MTDNLLRMAYRMQLWRKRCNYLTGFVKSYLHWFPKHLTKAKAWKEHPPQPCDFDWQVSITHILLEPSLGCLAMQLLTASPLNFQSPQELEDGLRPSSSENLAGRFLQICSDIKGQTPKMQPKLTWWQTIYSEWPTECSSGGKGATI